MPETTTSIRVETRLADEAVKVLRAKSRADAVHIALREIVGLKRVKAAMKKNSSTLRFARLGEEEYERAERRATALLDQEFRLGGVIRAGRDESHQR
jgi:Arc/MetJ family transcription regulator